jgi:polysaccharide export outer membrane protein
MKIKTRSFRAHPISLSITVLLAIQIAPAGQSPNTPAGTERPGETQSSPQTAATPYSSNTILFSPEDSRLAPYDVISVTVVDAPELSSVYTISPTGSFSMPYLGTVSAQNKVPEELAAHIADGLRGRYLQNPSVSVAVQQYSLGTYFVQGAVRSPGARQIRGPASLLKLIALGSGLTDNHGMTAFILREQKRPQPGQPEGGTRLDADESKPVAGKAAEPGDYFVKRSVNITGLLKGNLEANVVLDPGDMVYIPPADTFFVVGEVRAPGPFPLTENTTLRQAIGLAQGTTFSAAAKRGIIFRANPETGQREEVKVDISAIMNGKKPDIALQPNDMIIVPNSRFKSISNTVLSTMGMAASQIPVRILLPRN